MHMLRVAKIKCKKHSLIAVVSLRGLSAVGAFFVHKNINKHKELVNVDEIDVVFERSIRNVRDEIESLADEAVSHNSSYRGAIKELKHLRFKNHNELSRTIISKAIEVVEDKAFDCQIKIVDQSTKSNEND